MDLKVGDKVKCVCDTGVEHLLSLKKVYTVAAVNSESEYILIDPYQEWFTQHRFIVVAEEAEKKSVPGTSAAKNDAGKPDLSLIPYSSMVEHAKAFMVGEKKYGRYNYTKGHKSSQIIAALLRHAFAYYSGEDYDPTDGQHHLGSVMACCSMILEQQRLGTLKDDRFSKEGKEEGDKK